MKAGEVSAEIEQKAIDEMKLMEGAVELVQFLEENGLHRAVLTRNLEKNLHYMRGLYLDEFEKEMDNGESIFYPIVARDTKAHPHHEEPLRAKPNPDGILHICSVWECHPSEIIMVGDSANDDMTAANRAGCRGAVLLTQRGGK